MSNKDISDYEIEYKKGYDAGYHVGYEIAHKEKAEHEQKELQKIQNNKKKLPIFNTVEILNKSGKHLKKIQMGEPMHEDDNVAYDKQLCLGPIFEKIDKPRIAFGELETTYLNFYHIYNKENKTINGKYTGDVLTIPYDLKNNIKKLEINKILNNLRKDAQYGDLQTLETKTDHSVRKGYDIDLTNQETQKIIEIDNELIENLEKLFCDNMKMYNIKITPYKINIYEKDDFFDPHIDSPEKNLIGTIVFHLHGDYDCMMVENTLWKKEYGNVLMFYTDVVHQVNPVKSHRQTISFKVWNKCETGNYEIKDKELTDNPEYIRIIKEISLLVPKNENFSVLLQNGYTFDNVFVDSNTENIYSLSHNLKGNDQTLHKIAKILDYKIRFVPVIVENRTKIDRYDSTCASDTESEEEWFDDQNNGLGGQGKINIILTKTHALCDGNPDEINNLLNIYTAGKKMLSALYGISHTDAKILHDKLYDFNCNNIFYMGLGFKIGSHKRRNMLIGNQCTGSAKDNVYLNIMMICYK